jgi:hypothetical protein
VPCRLSTGTPVATPHSHTPKLRPSRARIVCCACCTAEPSLPQYGQIVAHNNARPEPRRVHAHPASRRGRASYREGPTIKTLSIEPRLRIGLVEPFVMEAAGIEPAYHSDRSRAFATGLASSQNCFEASPGGSVRRSGVATPVWRARSGRRSGGRERYPDLSRHLDRRRTAHRCLPEGSGLGRAITGAPSGYQ